MDFEKLLIKFNDSSLPENFVAITTKIVDKTPTHAGILIRYNNKNYLHHFPGSIPPLVQEEFNEVGWYIYKIVDFINNDKFEVASFLQYCQNVCENSNITYSYITDGSRFDNNGNFISSSNLPEFGTCVGFCINTLKGAMIDVKNSLFELDDWDDSEIDVAWDEVFTLRAKNKYPNLDIVAYNAFKKRILPIEYLCSSFLDDFPIKKTDITVIRPMVQLVIDKKFA